MLKTLISILAGLVAGVPVVAIVARIGHILYPPPQGMDLTDRNVAAAMIAQMPVGALLFVVAGWVLGALVAGLIAARLSRRSRPTYIVTAIFLGLCGLNFVMIPHPVWMVAATLVLVPLTGLVSARLFARS